jgi:transposase
MVAPIPLSIRSKIVRYLLLNWRPDAIVKEVHCSPATVYNVQQNLFIYGQPNRPHFHPIGGPRRICTAVENALFAYLKEQPWIQQQEMVWYLWEEWGIHVHRFIISRLLKRRGWSNKKATRIGSRDEELRQHWIADLLDMIAEQLVFVDESMFNETIGWRLRAYALIGQPARYRGDITRGRTWSVLPAYTTEGYLPCTGIKEGYYNGDDFYNWIINDLLPLCNAYSARHSVIIMDNNFGHVNRRIQDAIEARGCRVKYLPLYSPDYNPIELSFSVLKAWMRRHFHEMWPRYDGSFGEFLRCALDRSQCDQFATKHFKHSAGEGGGYIFEGDIQALNERLYAGNIEFE